MIPILAKSDGWNRTPTIGSSSQRRASLISIPNSIVNTSMTMLTISIHGASALKRW